MIHNFRRRGQRAKTLHPIHHPICQYIRLPACNEDQLIIRAEDRLMNKVRCWDFCWLEASLDPVLARATVNPNAVLIRRGLGWIPKRRHAAGKINLRNCVRCGHAKRSNKVTARCPTFSTFPRLHSHECCAVTVPRVPRICPRASDPSHLWTCPVSPQL